MTLKETVEKTVGQFYIPFLDLVSQVKRVANALEERNKVDYAQREHDDAKREREDMVNLHKGAGLPAK